MVHHHYSIDEIDKEIKQIECPYCDDTVGRYSKHFVCLFNALKDIEQAPDCPECYNPIVRNYNHTQCLFDMQKKIEKFENRLEPYEKQHRDILSEISSAHENIRLQFKQLRKDMQEYMEKLNK